MPDLPPEPRESQPSSDSAGEATPIRVLDTADLFPAGVPEVRLRHRGEEYRLRITRQGKLILTK